MLRWLALAVGGSRKLREEKRARARNQVASANRFLGAGLALLLGIILLVPVFSGHGWLELGQAAGRWARGGASSLAQIEAGLRSAPLEEWEAENGGIKDQVVLGAWEEVLNGTTYDASYQEIDYPGGDVDPDRGACTDVVIRAYRNAGIDLQKRVHEDMRDNFDEYPQEWGQEGPDPNIDHRRVLNLMTYFERHGESLTTEVEGHLSEWEQGHVVAWQFDDDRYHIGIISARTNAGGKPLAIHNAGIAREEDCLTRWEIVGHYRYPADGEE